MIAGDIMQEKQIAVEMSKRVRSISVLSILFSNRPVRSVRSIRSMRSIRSICRFIVYN